MAREGLATKDKQLPLGDEKRVPFTEEIFEREEKAAHSSSQPSRDALLARAVGVS